MSTESAEDDRELAFDELPQPDHEGVVPTDSLDVDGDNPNTMPPDAFETLKEKMETRGWVGNAIVTDMDGVIADGEHRWLAARQLGLDAVPVKQYDFADGERRLVRQEMNKIHGEHDIEDDAAEYERILAESDSARDVEALARSLATDDTDIEKTLSQFGASDDDDPAIGDDDGVPDEFPDVSDQQTEHECPNCGYEF